MKPQETTEITEYKQRTQNISKVFILLFLCGLSGFLSVFSVVPLPLLADYLFPLKEKTYLTGTFGEFRKNHIHAGIDVSTHGQTGLPVYAGESATLYRVKTQYVGFGKTVYIKLADGRFLVYAHLDEFSPKIEKIINNAQLKNNQYEVDVYPETRINIKKGELIGFSGDSGGAPPHLHFELRDSKERPLNILKNGLNVPDKKYPIITGLAVCDPVTSFVIADYPAVKIPTIYISGKTGLAVSVYEESHGNRLGIYQIDLLVDGKLFFRVKMDSFSYDEFYDNFFVYNKDLYINEKRIYHNLFRAFNNKLPFYTLNTDGILDLTPGQHSLIVKAMDHQGNTNTLNATIIAKPVKKPLRKKLKAGPWYSEDGKLCVKIDNLYSPVGIKVKTLSTHPKPKELVPVSKIYEIIPKEAVFEKARIAIEGPSNTEKISLYRFENKKWKYTANNTCRTLTKFCLFKDTTPPKIQAISPFKAKIEDKGSGLDYDKLALYLDGKKVIAEYSVNKKELFYKENFPLGKHKVTWEAVDRAGNQTKKEFIYNEQP